MEHKPIETFMDTLSKWAVHKKDYQGFDYLTILIIISSEVGYKDIPTDYDYNKYELKMRTHLIYLVENNKISEVFLIRSLTNFLSQYLHKGMYPSLSNLLTGETILAEHPDMKLAQKLVNDNKSMEKQAAYRYDYFSWLKLSVNSLGEDSLEMWENDYFANHAKNL